MLLILNFLGCHSPFWVICAEFSCVQAVVSRPELEFFNVHKLIYVMAHWGCMHTVTTVRECTNSNSNTVIVDSGSG